MLLYRSLPYYFLVALFVIGLSFGGFTGSFKISQLFNHNNIVAPVVQNKPKPNYQLVELMDNTPTDMKKSYVLSPKQSRGVNKSYSMFNNSTSQMGSPTVKPTLTQNNLEKEMEVKKKLNSLNLPNLNPNGDTPFSNEEKKDFSKSITKPQRLGSKGSDTQHVSVKMDSQGNLSINALEYKNAQYLIDVAKSVFYYWVQFIPFNLVYQGYIKMDSPGVMQGIIEFANTGKDKFKVSLRKPFTSNNLNEMTQNAFEYYKIPPPKDDKVKLKALLAQFTIHQDTLQVEANFDFDVSS